MTPFSHFTAGFFRGLGYRLSARLVRAILG